MNFDKFKDIFKDRKVQVEDSDEKEKELKLIDDWTKKFEESRMAKQVKVEMWNKCIDAYNSDYFKSTDKPDYKSDEISNYIFSTIETIKPIMVDNDPKITTLPRTPESLQVIDKIQNAFDSEWSRAKMGKKLVQAITISLQTGTAVFAVLWDKSSDKGIGNVNPILINPYNFFPDPMATEIDNAEYVIYATYKHVNLLKQMFSDKANLLESGAINYKELVSFGNDTSNVKNQVLVLECWSRDYTTYDESVSDPEDETKQVMMRKRKYPNGRVLTIAPEIRLLLEDKPNPYKDGKFPFHLLKCYDVPFEFWGKSEIEQLLSPQTYINDLVNQVVDNAKLTANMPWVLDKNSGIGKGQLTNRPGLIVRKNPGSDVKRLQPPQMPVYVQELIETFKRDIEIISGVHDVTQGRKPGSVSAASAIMALQEAAQARIRLKVKLMELTLGEIGQTWYSRMQQFWIVNRWIRQFDENEQIQFSEITPEDLQANVDFQVVGGSTMPTNKNAMLDLMIRLAQTMAEDGLPMVDRETVLAYTSVPDRKKIVQRFAQKVEQQKAEAQAQSQEAQMQQQAMMEQQSAMQTAQSERQAEFDQTANTNTQITDEQIDAVVKMLMQNPEMLQQLLQPSATSTKAE